MTLFLRRSMEKLEQLTKERTGLYTILCVTALTKIIVYFIGGGDAVNTDGVKYIIAAQELASGHFQQALAIYPMPAFPTLIAILHTVFQDWVMAGRMVSMVLSILAVVPLYFLTRGLFGPTAAFWAALAYNLHPFGNKMSILVYRGPGYIFFVSCTLWAMLSALRNPSVARLTLAFLTSVLAASMRIEGVFFVVLFPLTIMILASWQPRFRGRPLLISIAWLLLLTGLVIALSMGNSQGLSGINRLGDVISTFKDFVNMGFLKQYMKIYHHLEAMESLSPLPTENQNFGEIARHYLWLIYLVGLLESIARALFPPFLILALIGIKKSRFDLGKSFLMIIWILYATLLYYQLISHDYTGKRFVWACSFMLFPWVGCGMDQVFNAFKNRPHALVLKTLLLSLFLGLPLSGISKAIETKDTVAITAGNWLRDSGCASLKILGNDYRIPFYANIHLDFKNLPENSFIYVDTKLEGLSVLEDKAIATNRDLIVIKLPKKHSVTPPIFKHYSLIKKFDARRRAVYVFATEEAMTQCKDQAP